MQVWERRVWLGILACIGLVPCISCALALGLDQLQEVSCIGTCGDAGSDVESGNPSDSDDLLDTHVLGDAPISSDSYVAVDSGGDEGADSSPCTQMVSGLIGHWTMDTASISGTVLSDSSGNGSNGTLVGFTLPVTAPGRFGQALVYPATGTAYVLVPDLALDTTEAGVNTVSMWFYRDGMNVDDVLALLPNSPRYDLWLTSDNTDASAGDFLCINTGAGECVGVQDDTLLSRWVHVVALFVNGPTVEDSLYVDGQNRAVACFASDGFGQCSSSAVAASPVYFGGEEGFFFHGMLDDVRMYNRALTPAEVLALYNGTACP